MEMGVRFRLSFRARLTLAALVIQIPAVLQVGHLTDQRLLSALGAALLSAGYLALGARRPDQPKSRLTMYLVLWPFFAWWAACFLFLLAAPLALGLGWLLRAPAEVVLRWAALAASLGGLLAIRRTPRVRRVELEFADLPAVFDGYKIVQLSDLHCGSFAPEHRVRDWARRATRLAADLAVVTGDLITSGNLYHDDVARALGELRARDGVFVTLGNHDYFCDAERLVARLEAAGLEVLRNGASALERDGHAIHIAGVDDTWTGRADLGQALAGREGFVVLLAHDPTLFPQAAARGVQLTLSGHTHGGQVAVPGLGRRINLARALTRFTTGLYRLGDSVLYVSRGVGTTGPPLRIGARAEITLVTLRSAA
jgi:predicted MPP superfamily phosphohydrolase